MTFHGYVRCTASFSVYLPVCPCPASSEISFRMPQNPSGSAPLYGASESSLPSIHPLLRMPLRMPEEEEFNRLLGRHAPPHVFHRQDLQQLMASGRRAVAPVSMGSLPANYPIHMYNAVAGGIQRWSSAVCPPLPHAMRSANLPAASLLRNFWNISADHLFELFLQRVTFGWTGLSSALPPIVLSSMSSNQHQLNRPNTHQGIYPTRACSSSHPIPMEHALSTTRSSTWMSG